MTAKGDSPAVLSWGRAKIAEVFGADLRSLERRFASCWRSWYSQIWQAGPPTFTLTTPIEA